MESQMRESPATGKLKDLPGMPAGEYFSRAIQVKRFGMRQSAENEVVVVVVHFPLLLAICNEEARAALWARQVASAVVGQDEKLGMRASGGSKSIGSIGNCAGFRTCL